MSRSPERNRKSRGFTLLEVLVAISLIGIALLIITQLFSANLRGLATADTHVQAVIKAEEAMREVLNRKSLAEGTTTEMKDNRYRVDVQVKEALPKRTDGLQYQLYEVTVTLRWSEGTKGRSVTLSTLKLMERKV